jgi:glycosyltransferase involved in cell wall biosynthesis
VSANGPGAVARLRQARRLLISEGAKPVASRLLDRVSRKLSPPGLSRLDITRADLTRAGELAEHSYPQPGRLPLAPGEPMTVAWVTTPPTPGSGGHTTMFRMVQALQDLGHRCIVYLHDPHQGALEHQIALMRQGWPWVTAEVRGVRDGIDDAHAIFATGWYTAYPVLTTPARGARFYLVQDFEPWFAPIGSVSLLTEETYRFGFHGVTAGRFLAHKLSTEYGMPADHFDFGCDRDVYRLPSPASEAPAGRAGICYYSRPTTPRRAFELAVVALDLFKERHPDVDVHIFGGDSPAFPFPVIDHGKLTPAGLNELYGQCVAGLALSATNVSLVPQEMLAAGCIPVVNDAPHNRMVLDLDTVAWSPPSPYALAATLGRLVERSDADRAAAAWAAADSVRGAPAWADAGATVEQVVRRVVTEAQPAASLVS